MKVALCSIALIASASAFAPQATTSGRSSVVLSAESSRREAFGLLGAVVAAIPAAASAATGESPRFSVFGLVGDGTSYSEGAAYGSDQSTKVYSPYSVYGEEGPDSAYKKASLEGEFDARKKATIAESKKRLANLPGYIGKKEWSNVKTELTRYMYETRGAVRGLARTVKQKEAAEEFFKAIEETNINATLKKQDACLAAAEKSVATLDKFTSML